MTGEETLLEIGETYYLPVYLTDLKEGSEIRTVYIGWTLEGFSESGENAFLKGVDGGDMTTLVKTLERRAFTEVTDEIENVTVY